MTTQHDYTTDDIEEHMPEETASHEPEVVQDSEVEKLRRQLMAAQDQARRALADYQNLVRQNERERESFFKLATETQLVEWLPIVDSLVVAAGHLNDVGLTMVIKQAEQLLERMGVKTINPESGSEFEPHLHECVETLAPTDEKDLGKISKTTMRGYAWDDNKVIRHAKVAVWQKK